MLDPVSVPKIIRTSLNDFGALQHSPSIVFTPKCPHINHGRHTGKHVRVVLVTY